MSEPGNRLKLIENTAEKVPGRFAEVCSGWHDPSGLFVFPINTFKIRVTDGTGSVYLLPFMETVGQHILQSR